MVILDEIDYELERQDGLVIRPKDPSLCHHGEKSKCLHCLPLDPFDEEYLKEKGIKHMSFHAYLRKLHGLTKSSLNRHPLTNISCKIKPGCPNHRPWPKGLCDKCRPADLTLNRQRHRHVDNISFENELLVSRFIDFWRASGSQRVGYLLGYFEPHADVPLGIRAVAAAIYEPPQTAPAENVVRLASMRDASDDVVDQLAAALGLRRVGWIFTDLAPDDKLAGRVKCFRNSNSYFLSAEECITAGAFQNQYPNPTNYCIDEYFGSKFATAVITGDSDGQVQLYGYQVSNQCATLVANECLVPTKDAPEWAYVPESGPQKYVPDVNYMAKDEYGNDVRKVGRPLPVEYLIVDVPASMPKEPRASFTASANFKHFPIENRTLVGQTQDTSAVAAYVRQFKNDSLLDMVSDFHFLLYLITNDTLRFSLKEIEGLCKAVKDKDRQAMMSWMNSSSTWATFMQIMTHHEDAEGIPSSSPGWPCKHCTFVNKSSQQDCEVCGLPKE